MKSEVWKSIEDWPMYEVSSLGRVRSHWNKRANFLKPHTVKGKHQYPRVSLYTKEGKQKTQKVCILVAKAFLGPKPQSSYHCAHLNGDYQDSRADNLAWVSPKENQAHRIQHGTALMGDKHPSAKLNEQMIREIRCRYVRYRYNLSNAKELAVEFGVKKGTIQAIARGKAWRHI